MWNASCASTCKWQIGGRNSYIFLSSRSSPVFAKEDLFACPFSRSSHVWFGKPIHAGHLLQPSSVFSPPSSALGRFFSLRRFRFGDGCSFGSSGASAFTTASEADNAAMMYRRLPSSSSTSRSRLLMDHNMVISRAGMPKASTSGNSTCTTRDMNHLSSSRGGRIFGGASPSRTPLSMLFFTKAWHAWCRRRRASSHHWTLRLWASLFWCLFWPFPVTRKQSPGSFLLRVTKVRPSTSQHCGNQGRRAPNCTLVTVCITSGNLATSSCSSGWASSSSGSISACAPSAMAEVL